MRTKFITLTLLLMQFNCIFTSKTGLSTEKTLSKEGLDKSLDFFTKSRLKVVKIRENKAAEIDLNFIQNYYLKSGLESFMFSRYNLDPKLEHDKDILSESYSRLDKNPIDKLISFESNISSNEDLNNLMTESNYLSNKNFDESRYDHNAISEAIGSNFDDFKESRQYKSMKDLIDKNEEVSSEDINDGLNMRSDFLYEIEDISKDLESKRFAKINDQEIKTNDENIDFKQIENKEPGFKSINPEKIQSKNIAIKNKAINAPDSNRDFPDPLPDPMKRDIPIVIKEVKLETKTSATAQDLIKISPVHSLKIQSIIEDAKGAVCVIDGEFYKEGSVIHDHKIKKIHEDGIIVTDSNGLDINIDY